MRFISAAHESEQVRMWITSLEQCSSKHGLVYIATIKR